MAQTKKVSQVFEKKRIQKTGSLSHLEQQVGQALQESINHLDGQNKRIGSFIKINKAIEVPNGKEKPSILVYVSFRSQKALLTPLYKKLITDLEKKLKTTVLMISARNIDSRWIKRNRTQQRPYSRTLTAVYEQILNELLLPGIIIASRTRVRLDGSSFRKITVDKNEQHFLQERVTAIKNAYRKLTTRQIQIDFQKDQTFYTLKKGQKK